MSPEASDRIVQTDIEQEMKRSFITYAMSVIVSRALPDVRDGLKPVQRRILYNMSDAGNTADKPYRKAAKTVGDVLGRFHPHGDTAVYDAMVRMAQDWNLRAPLVDGQGNFGSVDGDPPAAMRYTEARLSRIAGELLTDIDKDTVDFVDNYDNTEKEPTVLPARFPNLLVNGSSGIAVGMATSIPPHNLGEVIEALIHLIDKPTATVDELVNFVKGPDFPTGGFILGRDGIRQAYQTGRGAVTMRAKASLEPYGTGRIRIVVTELPYLVNKARLIERIADLVRDRKIEGIVDLRDESDRTGIRVVVEVRRDANANVVLNQLYKFTPMQSSFAIHMLALVNGRPVTLNLRDALTHYLQHQKEVVVRRARYELRKAEARAHIIEGLLKALDAIDAIIAVIRQSPDTDTARQRLMKEFGFSEVQAQHILDMQLRRLTALERHKLQEEYEELLKQIEYLKAVVSSDRMQYSIIKQELGDVKKRFADPRRSRITDAADALTAEDLIQEEDIAITITHLGYTKRLLVSTYRAQRRGGRGIKGASSREEDFIEHLFITTTHHDLLFFTDQGRCYRLKAHEVPEASRTAKGTALVNLINLQSGEKVQTVIPVKDVGEEGFLFFATRMGYVKKTAVADYSNVRAAGLIALHLEEGDGVIGVKLTDGSREVILVSSSGHAIRFHENDVRQMGRDTRGVRGITLEEGAAVVGMDLVTPDDELLVVTRKGMGKRTPLGEYPTYTRGARGVRTIQLTQRTGDLVAIRCVREESELLLLSENGLIIRTAVKGIRRTGRVAQGVNVMNVGEDDALVAVAEVVTRDEED